jgi:hypothetical protein
MSFMGWGLSYFEAFPVSGLKYRHLPKPVFMGLEGGLIFLQLFLRKKIYLGCSGEIEETL